MGKIVNRARMTVAGAPGAGAISLNAAVAGHQSFAAAGVANGDVVSYVAESAYSGGVATVWECGLGTYSTTGPTLTRTSISSSSSGGGAVALGADAQVFVTATAADLSRGGVSKAVVTASGSVTVPSWATRIDIYAVGGGGSGANYTSGTTGKPGTCTYNSYTVAAGSVSTLTVAIGAAGDWDGNWNMNGVGGGATTVTGTGISVSAAGGAGNGGPFSVAATRLPYPAGFILPGYGNGGIGESSGNATGYYGSGPGAVVIEFFG